MPPVAAKADARPHLTIRVGAPGERERSALHADYLRALAESPGGPIGRRAMWIAPTDDAAYAMRDALASDGPPLLDPGVTTFGRFADELLRQSEVRLRTISSLQRRQLISRIIRDAAAAGKLRYFGPVAGTPGLVGMVVAAARDAQQRCQSAADLRRAVDQTVDFRQHDLAVLVAAYFERMTAHRCVDADGLIIAASQWLDNARASDVRIELLVVDGFTHLTSAQEQLLWALARRSNRTLVTLPGEANDCPGLRTELFVHPQATADSLRRRGGAVATLSDPATTPARSAVFDHLRRNLFRAHHKVEPVPTAAAAAIDSMHIVAASGVQAEIDDIARRVKQLLVDGVAPGDVVVAFRRTRDVAERVRQAFDDYGIPAAIDSGRPLAAAPLFRSLLAVLRMAAEDWPYRRVMQVVGDRTLRCLDAPGMRAAVEFCVRMAQTPRGRRALLAQLERWSRQDDCNEPDPPTARRAYATLADLSASLDKLPKQADLDEWLAALGALSERLGLLRPAANNADAAWAILENGVRAIGRIDEWTGWSQPKRSLVELIDLLADVGIHANSPQSRDTTGRVRVLSAEAARLCEVKRLFVGGLSEQSFPALQAGNSVDPSDSAASHSSEMLLFYELVTRPTETLTLSFPALDERAQALPPSPYLVELQRAFGATHVPCTTQPLAYARVAAADAIPLSRCELRRAAVDRALNGDRKPLAAIASLKHPRSDVGQSILAGVEAVADRTRRDRFGPFEGLAATDAAAAWLRDKFGPDHLWSPSRIEQYAECPYRFFGEHVLALRPLPDLALACDMGRRGSMLHETLARLYGELSAAKIDADLPVDALAARFRDVLASAAQERPGHGLDAALREIERRQIAAWAETFADQHNEYRIAWSRLDEPPQPTHFEARFGPGGDRGRVDGHDAVSTVQPFELAVPIDGMVEPVRFTGQIDRIDIGRVGERVVFNVIDYKTSSRAAVDEDEILAGRQVQLALYVMAAEELLLAGMSAAPLSAGYWSIQGQGFRSRGKGAALAINQPGERGLEPVNSWAEIRSALAARIGEIIAGIRRGHFPVFNPDDQCTRFCELRTVCRIGQVRSLEKQWPPIRHRP